MSAENLFKIRPRGLQSKNSILARSTTSSMLSCRLREALTAKKNPKIDRETARNITFAFCDSDPSKFDYQMKTKLAKAKIHTVFGIKDENEDSYRTDTFVLAIPESKVHDVIEYH